MELRGFATWFCLILWTRKFALTLWENVQIGRTNLNCVVFPVIWCESTSSWEALRFAGRFDLPIWNNTLVDLYG